MVYLGFDFEDLNVLKSHPFTLARSSNWGLKIALPSVVVHLSN